MPADRTWWLYLIECRRGGIYTGIALNVEKRYQQHVTGKGARYTRMNPPVRLLGCRTYLNHRDAAQAEWRITQLPSLEKRQLAIALHNHG
ncbi:MAG: GIY-YIG nuclease family protein [Gammaproteobacteria bacterium]|nr:GIY-YIG nuclease family protein [Gammaproteobacteria bacterium]